VAGGPSCLLSGGPRTVARQELLKGLAGHSDGPADSHRADLPALDQLVGLVDADAQLVGDLLDLDRFLSDTIAEKVRAYRLLRRLKQGDVAEEMRKLRHPWTQATASQVERGQRHLTVDELAGLSIVFNVSLNELLDPVPVDGGPPPALDIGLPFALPPDMVRRWSAGASLFFDKEAGSGKVRITAVGGLAEEEERQ
jgi:transcriptional regulator with XRE-family HTH domain